MAITTTTPASGPATKPPAPKPLAPKPSPAAAHSQGHEADAYHPSPKAPADAVVKPTKAPSRFWDEENTKLATGVGVGAFALGTGLLAGGGIGAVAATLGGLIFVLTGGPLLVRAAFNR